MARADDLGGWPRAPEGDCEGQPERDHFVVVGVYGDLERIPKAIKADLAKLPEERRPPYPIQVGRAWDDLVWATR